MGDGIGDMAFWLAMGLAALGLFFGPVGRALGRWIETATARREPVPPEVEQRLLEFDQMSHRMGELEERLDFAERMLARQRETPAVGPGDAR